MHSYDKLYNYCEGMMSRYTDDPAEIVAAINEKRPVRFISTGWAKYIDHGDNGVEIIRRTDDFYTPIEFLALVGVVGF